MTHLRTTIFAMVLCLVGCDSATPSVAERGAPLVGDAGASCDAPLLNRLSNMPLWASFLGARIEQDERSPGRVRRSLDGAQHDLKFEDGSGDTDLLDLAAFCGDGSCWLTRAYNAVPGCAYRELPAAEESQQAIVYEDGVPVIGETGYLAARFDGSGISGGSNIYSRDDALGLSGDVDLTLVADYALGNEDPRYSGLVGIGDSGQPEVNYYLVAAVGYDSEWSHGYAQGVIGASQFNEADDLPSSTDHHAWMQLQHAVGEHAEDLEIRIGGVAAPITYFEQSPSALPLNLPAVGEFWWGRYSRADAPSIGGLGSFVGVWSAPTLGGDQAVLDEWMEAHES